MKKNALSSIKNYSDCILTLTTEKITFVNNHTCRSISIICCIDPLHKSFCPIQSCNLNHYKDGQAPKALSTTTYIYHNHRNPEKHK